jgi:hypothetical protein
LTSHVSAIVVRLGDADGDSLLHDRGSLWMISRAFISLVARPHAEMLDGIEQLRASEFYERRNDGCQIPTTHCADYWFLKWLSVDVYLTWDYI